MGGAPSLGRLRGPRPGARIRPLGSAAQDATKRRGTAGCLWQRRFRVPGSWGYDYGVAVVVGASEAGGADSAGGINTVSMR